MRLNLLNKTTDICTCKYNTLRSLHHETVGTPLKLLTEEKIFCQIVTTRMTSLPPYTWIHQFSYMK